MNIKFYLPYITPIKKSKELPYVTVDDTVIVSGINEQPDFEANFRGFTGNLAMIWTGRNQFAVEPNRITLKESKDIGGNQNAIEYAYTNDLYPKFVKEGIITQDQADEIIKSAGF